MAFWEAFSKCALKGFKVLWITIRPCIKVGSVNALPLPMSCTLNKFLRGNRYHFAVRACDINKRLGEFSAPISVDI